MLQSVQNWYLCQGDAYSFFESLAFWQSVGQCAQRFMTQSKLLWRNGDACMELKAGRCRGVLHAKGMIVE